MLLSFLIIGVGLLLCLRVSGVTIEQIFANASIKNYDHDPGSTAAVVVSGDGGTTKNYLALAPYTNFVLDVMTSVSTSSSGPSTVSIVAATDSSGTNKTIIVTTTPSTASTHVGDNIVLECTAQQVNEVGKAAGYNFTHVAGRLTCNNSGDEAAVCYIRAKPKYPQSALTATTIA